MRRGGAGSGVDLEVAHRLSMLQATTAFVIAETMAYWRFPGGSVAESLTISLTISLA